MTRLLLLVLALSASMPALAAVSRWQSVPGAGQIHWTAHWEGTPVNGGFHTFRVTARLDPAHPATGTLTVHISIASVTTRSPDVAKAIRGPQWFAVASHPQALYKGQLHETHRTLQAEGTLRLKGREHQVTFPLTLKREGGRLLLRGRFELDRRDFDIGSGQWKSGALIARRVAVQFSVPLAPAP